ncbi:hypothetical protein KSP40_PGU021115 [Platanthera guangdongensis]|uniref:DUF7032 domain-containing protein n=1 Tax=Platanthera guangdongensis TaxID=2320717 RepID=A0ABR2MBN4_9ASPA
MSAHVRAPCARSRAHPFFAGFCGCRFLTRSCAFRILARALTHAASLRAPSLHVMNMQTDFGNVHDVQFHNSYVHVKSLQIKIRFDMNSADQCALIEVMTAIENALNLLNSAVSSTYSIKLFPVKWQSIRTKLKKLHFELAMANNGGCRGISPLTKLLEAISFTAQDADLLARHCTDGFFNGGKLLMNSNLDVMAAKLEVHIKQLCEIYSSGLMNSRAIVLSKPRVGAKREDMKLYVKDLFSRIRIGELEMRLRALAALNEVLQEDEMYVRDITDEEVDGVSVLVNILEFRDMCIKEEALQAVSVISGFNSYRGMLVNAGVVPQLIQILEREALKNLTENCSNSWLVSSQGGVMPLLKICRDNEGGACKLVSLACGVLKNISGVDEIKRFMVEEGVVRVLLKLLRSKDDEAAKIQAMEFLYKLASEDEAVKQEVVTEEMLESLLAVMNPDKLYSWKAREITLRAIEGLCFSSSVAVHYLLNSGFLHQIHFFLRKGEKLDQETALKTAFKFCRASEEVKKAMGRMGFMAEFMRLLEAKSCDAREIAAESICSLMSVQKNRRRFIEEQENINRVLRLLDSEEAGNSATKKLLLSVLMSITDFNAGRKMIGASTYVKNLEKLVESDLADAKKIMKRISSNRFRSILRVIWTS